MAGDCKSGIRPEDILSSELYGILIQAAGEAKPLGAPAILEAIRDAEAFYEMDLQLFLSPTRIASDPIERELDPTTYDVAVPAQDYMRHFFAEDRWGWFDLDYRPVISVEELFIAYPGAIDEPHRYRVPPEWRRVDYRAGRVQLVPTRSTGAASFLNFQGQLFGLYTSGRSVPQSIYTDYTAGISERDLAKLRRGIRIRAALYLFPTLGIVRNRGLGSQSLSEDGLSRSQSFGSGPYGPYSGAIKQFMEQEKEVRQTWADAEGGVLCVVA